MFKRKRTLAYSVIITLFALVIVLYAAVNSPRVIKKIVDSIAPNYHITYQRISGDLLNGLKIEDLRYEQKPLCKALIIRWNPTALLYKKISVSKLVFHDVHYQNLKMLYEVLERESEQHADDKRTYLSYLIPDRLSIAYFEVTTLPMMFDTLEVESLHARIEDIDILLDTLMINSNKVDLRSRSSLADIHYRGAVKNNETKGVLTITALQKAIRAYQLPIREDALKKVLVEIDASQNEVKTNVSLAAESLLDDSFTKGKINVDIQKLVSKAVYDIKQNTFKAESSILCTTPYAKDINVSNDLISKNSQIAYEGQLNVGEWTAMEQNITDPLEDMHISYRGTMQNLHADITAKNLTGVVKSEDLKYFDIHLGSIKDIRLSRMIQLPKELETTKFAFDIDIPWVTDENLTQQATVKLRSNVTDIDANVTYDKHLKVQGESRIGKTSLLRSMDEKVNWDALSPMLIDAEFSENNVTANIQAKDQRVWLKARYNLNDRNLTGEMDINGLQAKIQGIPDKTMIIDTHVSSFETMYTSIRSLYHLETLPAVSGSADISAKIEALKTLELTLESPKLLYKTDAKTTHVISALKLKANINKEEVNLEHYEMRYNGLTLFATKPSVIRYHNDLVQVDPFWINDSMKVEGSYDYNISKGSFTVQAKNFPIQHQYADINVDTDLAIALDGNATSVNGSLTLLDGKILYDLMQKSFPSDSDIIIVQEEKAKQPNGFMDNLSVNVLVETKKPLVYRKPPVDIRVKLEGSLYKAVQSPLMVLGMVTLPKGGTYSFQNKTFTLNDSYIYFSGDINKPLLELGAVYEAHRYLIQIDIKGTPSSPNIRFSSAPSLTKEQILSVILFNSPESAEGYSSDDMMRMMGGVMAKSVLAHLGIDIDLLSIGEGSSLQVGKKLNKDITMIYINDEVPKVELKYKHNERLESVVGTSSQSSSYDLFYRKDY